MANFISGNQICQTFFPFLSLQCINSSSPINITPSVIQLPTSILQNRHICLQKKALMAPVMPKKSFFSSSSKNEVVSGEAVDDAVLACWSCHSDFPADPLEPSLRRLIKTTLLHGSGSGQQPLLRKNAPPLPFLGVSRGHEWSAWPALSCQPKIFRRITSRAAASSSSSSRKVRSKAPRFDIAAASDFAIRMQQEREKLRINALGNIINGGVDLMSRINENEDLDLSLSL